MHAGPNPPQSGFLAFVERWGNRLPEPAMLFVWLIGALMLLSALAAALGWSASLPFSGDTPPTFATLEQGMATFRAESLFSEANLRRLLTEMPKTFTGFAPLGLALLIMMAVSVADRSGLLSALIRASLRDVPKRYLTPAVVLVGMLSHHANDAAYLVYIPLAALLYAIVGRHPLAGLAAAFAAVAGGHSGNLFPGQFDIVLFSFTQEAARIVDPNWTMNPLGNWWFIFGMVVVFTPIIWFLTDRVIEPRLGVWAGSDDPQLKAEVAAADLTDAERRGLRRAGLALLAVLAFVFALLFWPGFTPLLDREAAGIDRMKPLFSSIVALFALMFVATGAAFGSATGTVRSDRDVLQMLVEGMRAMAPYIVFAFFAAHFVAMFNWSRLGPIIAIKGAGGLEALGLPPAVLLVSVLLFSSFLDLFIGSATAKWSALAPVVVPMFMLLGISPEMTTAAYRMGDSFTNILTPLMGYFPLILGFCRRWDPRFGVGSLLALMLPYGLSFMVAGVAMTAAWATFEWPLGPGAGVHWEMPGAQP
jgi:aminobenzoyl-glutamate transport protein